MREREEGELFSPHTAIPRDRHLAAYASSHPFTSADSLAPCCCNPLALSTLTKDQRPNRRQPQLEDHPVNVQVLNVRLHRIVPQSPEVQHDLRRKCAESVSRVCQKRAKSVHLLHRRQRSAGGPQLGDGDVCCDDCARASDP